MYQQRVTIRPNADKIAEARALLVARVKATQAAGGQAALGEIVAGKHAAEFQVILLFKDLAALDAMRKRNQADKSFQTFATRLASISREPAAIEIFEILVAMPGTDTSAPRPAAARAKRKAK